MLFSFCFIYLQNATQGKQARCRSLVWYPTQGPPKLTATGTLYCPIVHWGGGHRRQLTTKGHGKLTTWPLPLPHRPFNYHKAPSITTWPLLLPLLTINPFVQIMVHVNKNLFRAKGIEHTHHNRLLDHTPLCKQDLEVCKKKLSRNLLGRPWGIGAMRFFIRDSVSKSVYTVEAYRTIRSRSNYGQGKH